MMYALPAPAAAGPFEPGARLSGQRELADSARLSPISGRDITTSPPNAVRGLGTALSTGFLLVRRLLNEQEQSNGHSPKHQ